MRQAVRSFIIEMPLGKFGVFMFGAVASNILPWPLVGLAQVMAVGTVVGGVGIAWWRHRFLGWPVMFWTLGVAQLDYECTAWLRISSWTWFLRLQMSRLLWLAGFPFSTIWHKLTKADPKSGAEKSSSSTPPSTPRSCTKCINTFSSRWFSSDAG